MLKRSAVKLWLFALGVTVFFGLPMVATSLWVGGQLTQREMDRHQVQVDNQLNQWQEQLYDVKWDAVADTSDDTLHLGAYDEKQLLIDTMRWYVYPDGHCFYEGMAVVDKDGRLRPSLLAAVIDEEGQKLPAETLDQIKAEKPWLTEPWLDDYSFVVRAFLEDPELDFYLSPLIKTSDRLVFVMASAKRDENGRFQAAVMAQKSAQEIETEIIALGAEGLNLWLMDRKGTLALSTSDLARASAQDFVASGKLEKIVAQGLTATEEGEYGASGRFKQELDGKSSWLSFRTEEGNFILGAVETEEAVGLVAQGTVRILTTIALISFLFMAAAVTAYTLVVLRREARMVEMSTIRRLAGTVSHGVRNRLVAIRGKLELVTAGKEADLDRIKDDICPSLEEEVEKIEETLDELERLGQRRKGFKYEGQAGRETMYQLKGDQKETEGR
ncbi:MAG: cache domain-containing protein [Deltaproteobacteria bacterium]|nr:cache domain-containing protein [Deltaproteobacteria bacterium]